MKMPLEDFLAEMRAEISGYEELGPARAAEWAATFAQVQARGDLAWVRQEPGGPAVLLADESDIFALADNFWAAVEDGQQEAYWRGLVSARPGRLV